MISHKHKVIFIHIPKSAGSSINRFFYPDRAFDYRIPDYDALVGWCPDRKIHLQHATPKQMLDTGLVSKEQWDSYFKFTIVRDSWDRAQSDYKWFLRTTKIKDTFENYIQGKGKYEWRMTDKSSAEYRGDHLLTQVEFTELDGQECLDFIGKFENLDQDMQFVLKKLNMDKFFNTKVNESANRLRHYSLFYNAKRRELVRENFSRDIKKFNFSYVEKYGNIEKFFLRLEHAIIKILRSIYNGLGQKD